MKKLWAGIGIGVAASLIVAFGALASLALYFHVGPGNVFMFDDAHMQGIYVIHAPEERTETQTRNLMEAHMIVLNLALDQPTEDLRAAALGYWAYVLKCGMDPLDPVCHMRELPVSPQHGKPL